MFNKVNKWWDKKWKSLKYEFNSALFVSFMVIIAYIVSNPVLTYIDDEYGLNMYMWFMMSHFFKLMPFIYDEYKRYNKNTCKLSVLSKLYFSFKKAIIQVGITDVILLASSYIPIVGNIVGILGMIPMIGDPLLFIGAYLFQIINEHLNPFYYLQVKFMTWIADNFLGTKFGDKCANPYFIMSLGAMFASMGVYTYNEVSGIFP
tara:strand:- start:2816 stop:3427 length:612 start_codon:yes stop_codon:yes gene_type:complete